jgi:hypothetical protein
MARIAPNVLAGFDSLGLFRCFSHSSISSLGHAGRAPSLAKMFWSKAVKYVAWLMFTGAVLVLSPAGAMHVTDAIAHVGVDSCGRNAICGLRNPEDVVRLGSTRFAIASSLARAPRSLSHLYLVDLASRIATPLVPTMDPDTQLSWTPTALGPRTSAR